MQKTTISPSDFSGGRLTVLDDKKKSRISKIDSMEEDTKRVMMGKSP